MDEIDQTINLNTGILLARNTPVALVVGADGFLGSHLVDRLLEKNIQVIGITTGDGEKENLTDALKNRDFHLLSDFAGNFKPERLDYILIVPHVGLNLRKIVELFIKHNSRLLLLSSVKLYADEDLKWLKQIETEVAQAAKEHNLNARILRLGALFGPRMVFAKSIWSDDPMIHLIQQSLNEDLQKEISLEFSSRALFIDDAVELAVKCILAGATAQKIFDGVSPSPVKVSEVKQILLDPIWYENREFTLSELPPWTTPNLEKTIKFLNWHPSLKLVENLRKTLQYFKDNEISVPNFREEELKTESGEKETDWSKEKSEQLKGLKGEGGESKIIKEKGKPKLALPYSGILLVLALILITYSLIWPVLVVGWGVLTFRFQLSSAIRNMEKGDFDTSLEAVNQAEYGISEAKSIYGSLEPIRKTGLFNRQFQLGDNLARLATLSTDSAQNTILGIEALYQSLKSVTGEKTDPPQAYFDSAQMYLASADEDLSKAQAIMLNPDFKSMVPGLIKDRVDSLSQRLADYSDLVKKARALGSLLPEVVGQSGSKTYLILLQNNSELRPAGGFIGSFATVNFEAGKLKNFQVNDIYAIDGQLKIHVEPPKEIAQDLGQKNYFLRDSNWEPDFPTAARQAEWFYNQETGQRVEGTLALDISAMEDLLRVLGPMDLPDYHQKISADNLFAQSVSHAEIGFFPGSQAKKSFLTALAQGLLNKLFFLPNQNWPAIVGSLGQSLEQKHLSVYLDDPQLFSYLVSQNWANVLPRQTDEKNKMVADFLAPVEANLGANKANYYLDRSYNLESIVGKDGQISQKLRIAYTNRSPSDVFPGGAYKNRMRLYLPAGSKLNKLMWGETDITNGAFSFVDYGRAGYSFLLNLSPKEQKTLVVEYQIPQKLQFEKNKAGYRLDVVKQAGTLKDPFVWTISYPLNMKISSDSSLAGGSNLGPQQQTITTDLSKDRSFEVQFSQ